MNKKGKKPELSLDELLKQLYNKTPTTLADSSVSPLTKSEFELENKKTLDKFQKTVESDEIITTKTFDKENNLELEPEKTQIKNDQVLLTNFSPSEIEQQKAIIEAGLFLAGSDGLNVYDLKRILSQWTINSEHLHELIMTMKAFYDQATDKGLTLEKFKDTYKLITKTSLHEALSKVIKIQLKSALTPSLLEVLAIIAYNEPCPKSLIIKIRNIDPVNQIDKLLKLDLIYKHKRAEVPGKPWLYKVSAKFYDLFGIKSTSQLPKISVKLDTQLNEEEQLVNQSLEAIDHDFFNANRSKVVLVGKESDSSLPNKTND